MPSPWSLTLKRTAWSRRESSSSTRPPSGEYFTALSTKFVSTWRTLSGAPPIGVQAARPEDVVHRAGEAVGLGRDDGQQVGALRLVERQVGTLQGQRGPVD